MLCNCVAHKCEADASTVAGLCDVCELNHETGGDCAAPDVPPVLDQTPVAELEPEPTVEQFDDAVNEGGLV